MSGAPAFTCPCCGAVSHHPTDLEQGYCARCNWWTADPALGPPHLAEPCEHRGGNPEFAAFRKEFRTHMIPEDQRGLWEGLLE